MISIEKENFKFLLKDNNVQTNINNYSIVSKNSSNTPDISKNINRKIYLSEMNPQNVLFVNPISRFQNSASISVEPVKDQYKEKKQSQNQNFFSKIGVDLLKPPKIPITNNIQTNPNPNTSLNQFLEQNKRRNIIRENNLLEKEKNENLINFKGNASKRSLTNKSNKNIKINLNQKAPIPAENMGIVSLADISSLNNSVANPLSLNDKTIIIPQNQNKQYSVSLNKNKNDRNINLSININENILLNYSNISNGSNLKSNDKQQVKSNMIMPNIQILNESSLKENIFPNIMNNLNEVSSISAMKNTNNYLKEITDRSSFLNHLKMFEINLETDDTINNYSNTNLYDNYYLNSYIKTINKNYLFTDLKKYFQIVKKEFIKGSANKTNEQTSNETECDFFVDESLNLLYQKLIKLQMIVMSILFVTLKNLSLDDFLKIHIRKLCSTLIYPMINFFECFVIHQPQILNDHYYSINLSQTFREKFKKIYKFNRMNRYFSTKDNVFFLNKFSDELITLIKQFPSMIKYVMLRPFYSVILQLTKSIDKNNLSFFSNILVNHVLFSTLSEEKKQNTNRGYTADNEKEIKNKDNEEPFLPVMKKQYSYTLVLDLDETLIHYFITPLSKIFFVRPHVFEFLIELQELYEIVIFTAGTKEYADCILDILDDEVGCLNHRLYRNHTSIVGGYIIKDLTKLGRDLSKVIIIDNIADNFRFQPNNGLHIKTWNNDIKDTQLNDLKTILRDIYLYEVNDVRDVIKGINEEVGKMKLKSYAKIDITKYINV